MYQLLIIIIISAFSFPSMARTKWFCKRNGKLFTIKHHRCLTRSSDTKRQAFCQPKNVEKAGRCGKYSVKEDEIFITYKVKSGKTVTKSAGMIERQSAEVEDESTPARTSGNNRSETTSGQRKGLKGLFGGGSRASRGLKNDYPPRERKFSRSFNRSISYTNLDWLNMKTVDQANYLFKKYKTINSMHGWKFPASMLICKAYRESVVKYKGNKIFQPQRMTPIKKSTASGVSQVTRSTAKDLFKRGKWFRSKVPGFEDITNGRTFHNQMAGNMIAQMEIGVAILEQKRRDRGFRSNHSVLAAYYGSRSSRCNKDYANRVTRCQNCVDKSGITVRCLDRALGIAGGC